MSVVSRHPGTTVGPVERSLETQVSGAVDAWLRWLPRWQIGTARPRTRICRKCTGSPIAAAAGFGPDVPHAVQHALIGRISTIVEDAVDHWTQRCGVSSSLRDKQGLLIEVFYYEGNSKTKTGTCSTAAAPPT